MEDKKRWEKERISSQQSPSPVDDITSTVRQHWGDISAAQLSFSSFATTTQPDETTAMRHEIVELNDRTAALEAALKEPPDESRVVREAVLSLASVGQRLKKFATTVLNQATKSEGQHRHQ